MTPAETLTAAATKLRDSANAVRDELKTNTYWHGIPAENAYAIGVENALGGPAGTHAARFGPDFTDAIAEWLESAAEEAVLIGVDVKALAVARAILAEVTP